MKKEETVITLANGGMHNQKAYRKMKDMLNNNCYTAPRLYHLVMMGSEQTREYQAAMKALCLELRRQDIPCQWKGCLEVDEEKGYISTFSSLPKPSTVTPVPSLTTILSSGSM